MYFRILNLVLICFFISSCSVVEYPSWYLTSNEDTNYLYGVGSSSNLQDAKFEALNDIASQISLNIESDINISKEQRNDYYSSNINSNIGINVDDIELNNLEYPKIEEVNNVFFVQARIKKEAIVSKLNSNINAYAVDINNILNSIKNSKCITLSPKHKYQLSLFMSKINLYVKQIRLLNGIVDNQSLIDNVNIILQNKPLAYYTSFAQGGKTSEYSLIQSAISNEYNKFFDLKKSDSDIYHIENRYNVIHNANKISISLYTNIKDCNNNVIFNTSFETLQNSKDINVVLDRLKAQLYKKIKYWVEE